MRKFQRKTIYQALGREPVHPFPARMAPGIALEIMSDMRESRVLDPMVGSGTVLAMARAHGHHGIGFDLDPLAVLISKVWTSSLDAEAVRDSANRVLANAVAEFGNIDERDAYPINADEEALRFVGYWFDGHTRRELKALTIAIHSLKPGAVQDALWCAFSRLIISKKSGASRARDLSHSRPHRAFARAPREPFKAFLSAVDRVVSNAIDRKTADRGPEPMVRIGDARALPLLDQSVDLVLTSPPYLNAIDYMRCSKFSLVWMGHSLSGLRQIRAESVGTEAGGHSLDDDKAIGSILDVLRLCPRLNQRRERMLRKYIDDMRGSIFEVARVLSAGGKAVFVVGENTVRGTYIRTAVIVTELAKLAGLLPIRRRVRGIPANRRYMPPPSSRSGTMNARMRREVVLTFAR
jgi:DNA modification methylase